MVRNLVYTGIAKVNFPKEETVSLESQARLVREMRSPLGLTNYSVVGIFPLFFQVLLNYPPCLL